MNGYAAPAWSLAQKAPKAKNIGDKQIDEEVVGFVRADKNTNPIQDRRRDEAWPINGWANTPPSKVLSQRNSKDIGDKNIDEEVVGFVRADKNTDPVRSYSREQPWPVNGWSNTPPSKAFAQRNSKDIGDKNIDEEVVGFVRADKNTDPVRSYSREQPWPVNGWSNTPPSKALA